MVLAATESHTSIFFPQVKTGTTPKKGKLVKAKDIQIRLGKDVPSGSGSQFIQISALDKSKVLTLTGSMHLIKKNLVSLIDSQGKVLKDIDLGSLIGSELAKNSAKKSTNKNSSVATDYVVTTTDGVLASAED